MNSTQHSMSRSLASLANVTPPCAGRISMIIFWTVAADRCQLSSMVVGADGGVESWGSDLWVGTDHRCLERVTLACGSYMK